MRIPIYPNVVTLIQAKEQQKYKRLQEEAARTMQTNNL